MDSSDSILSHFSYIARNFNVAALTDASASSSSAFSDCTSDRSGEFYSASSQTSYRDSDDAILQFVRDLDSSSVDDQKRAALELRLLAKNNPDNRIKIARFGAIKPLISIIASANDAHLQEYGVTAILNLSLCDENKEEITRSGAIKPLVRALRVGTPAAKENAACTLLRLSQTDKIKIVIGRSGAFPPLVNLLDTGSLRGKKDACTALYSLCSVKENKIKAVQAGIMKPLVEMMADLHSNLVDKSGFVLNLLVSISDARDALVKESGIPVLVEILEVGTARQKEVAAAILLQLCVASGEYGTMVAQEGGIPLLAALSVTGTDRAKHKAEALLEILGKTKSSTENEDSSMKTVSDDSSIGEISNNWPEQKR